MIELECGAWSATVATHGGGLVALRQHGRDVVVPQDGDGSHPAYSGAVLAPWPNRLEDGVYTFEGVTYEVPINEPEAATALHGLVHDIAWTVAAATPESVRLTVEVPRSAGFPFTVRLDLDYVLSSGGLNVALTATNAGDVAAPYGCGFHPYLVLDEGDETSLWIPAESYLETTPVRHLPLRRKEVAGSPYDFGSTRPLGSTVLDYAYTDLRRDETGEVVVRVGGTEVRCGPGVLWLQAYTPEGRGSLAVEPCSSPANAFRSGHDLVVLQPGSRHVLTWTIRRP